MCLSQTFAIKCLDVELLLRKTPTKGCCWPRNPRVACVCNSPMPICCLFLVLLWEHHSRQGRQRHSQVPTVLPGHQNTDLGAAKVQILLLDATTTCSTSALICHPPPAKQLSIQQSISRRAETTRCPKSTARPCPVLNPRLTERKRDYFFFLMQVALH